MSSAGQILLPHLSTLHLPCVQARFVVGVRPSAVLDARLSGCGMDAPEELPSGSMIRVTFIVPEVVSQSARLRAGYRSRGGL